MSQTVIRLDKERASVRNLKAYKKDIPKPTKHEVLIKVHGDNVIPCSDAAGVVVEVGEGVKNVAVGDHVIGTFDSTNLFGQQMGWLNGQGGPVDGVLREYLVAPSVSVVNVPQKSPQSFSEWSTLVVTGVTAWNALYGTGGVSVTGLILAKAAGAITIITSSSDEKLDFVKPKYGADFTVNYKTPPQWSKEVLRLTNDEGVDYILENGGSGTIAESINAVKMGGNISVIGFFSRAEQSQVPDVASLALGKGAVVRGITGGSTQLLQEVARFVARKGLRLPVEKEFRFTQEDVIKAYDYISSGSHIGKVCIRVAE